MLLLHRSTPVARNPAASESSGQPLFQHHSKSGGFCHERFQVDIQIRPRPCPGKYRINFPGRCGFRYGFEAPDHGEEDRGIEIGVVTEAEVEDRRRASRKAHAQAQSALEGTESELPPA